LYWLLHLPPTTTKNQNGFTADRSTDDGIFTSRMLLQKARQHGMEIWCLALDSIRAFDSVDRKLLWKYLEKLGVAKQLIHICKKLYERFATWTWRESSPSSAPSECGKATCSDQISSGG
jgi:hypothetical protein